MENGQIFWRAIMKDGVPVIEFVIGEAVATVTLDMAERLVADLSAKLNQAQRIFEEHDKGHE